MLEFDFWTILFSIINILVLFLFLKKFLFGRINAILEKRVSVVQDDMDKAKEEAQKAEKIRADYEASISGAREEAKKIIQDAQKTANAQSAAITQQAQEEANRIVESTRQELQLERERSVASAQNEIVSLAMEAAEKVLGREMADKDNRAIVDAFLEETMKSVGNYEKVVLTGFVVYFPFSSFLAASSNSSTISP